MTIEERLANLEWELAHVKRRNRRLLVAALLVAGAAVVAAAWIGMPGKVLAESGAKAPNVVRASKFILEDADGKVRALLTLNDGPALYFYDENGKLRAGLGALKGEVSLILCDGNAKRRAVLAANMEGPGLGLYDENGKVRAGLSAFKGGPSMELYANNGKVCAQVGVGETVTGDGRKVAYTESSMRLYNLAGNMIWAAP